MAVSVDRCHLPDDGEAGRIVSTAVILAVGVNADGRREVLGIATGASAAEPFWTAFLCSLADRGLHGMKLVIADDHKGLRAAASRVFHASHQLLSGALDAQRHGASCPEAAPGRGGDAQDHLCPGEC